MHQRMRICQGQQPGRTSAVECSPGVHCTHAEDAAWASHLCMVASRHSLERHTRLSGQPGASQTSWATTGLGSWFLLLAQAVCDSYNLVANSQKASRLAKARDSLALQKSTWLSDCLAMYHQNVGGGQRRCLSKLSLLTEAALHTCNE